MGKKTHLCTIQHLLNAALKSNVIKCINKTVTITEFSIWVNGFLVLGLLYSGLLVWTPKTVYWRLKPLKDMSLLTRNR